MLGFKVTWKCEPEHNAPIELVSSRLVVSIDKASSKHSVFVFDTPRFWIVNETRLILWSTELK